MAEAKAKPGSEAVSSQKAGGSWFGAIIGLVVVTAIAAGTGIGAAWYVQSGGIAGVEIVSKSANRSAKGDASTPNPSLKGVIAKPIPTIITNLAGDRRVWVRAEFAVLMPIETPATDALAALIGQDAIAYLRGVSPGQIDGPQGLGLLREEIEDRVRVRTGGRSKGVLFKTFVIE